MGLDLLSLLPGAKPAVPAGPSAEEVAAQSANNEAAMQREEASLYDNETIPDEVGLKKALISPQQVARGQKVYSRRDILTGNFLPGDPALVYVETDLISLCYYDDDLGGIAWDELAADLGDRFEDWMACKGGINGARVKAVLEKNANITRNFQGAGQGNPFNQQPRV